MKIAYTIGLQTGETDLLLASVAQVLSDLGYRLAGTVQVNSDRADCHRCDMDVLVLPDGPTIRISQSLGKDAKGCRLDPNALEHAVERASKKLSEGADILIVNKFGKHEANGRGFREVIAQALEQDIPVLVGTNHLNEAAFLDFVGHNARALAPKTAECINWVLGGGEKSDQRSEVHMTLQP